jgi:hypothetical protein
MVFTKEELVELNNLLKDARDEREFDLVHRACILGATLMERRVLSRYKEEVNENDY